jgi:hypothetical protein
VQINSGEKGGGGGGGGGGGAHAEEDATFDVTKVNQAKVNLDDFDLLKVIGRGAFGKARSFRESSEAINYSWRCMQIAWISIARGVGSDR